MLSDGWAIVPREEGFRFGEGRLEQTSALVDADGLIRGRIGRPRKNAAVPKIVIAARRFGIKSFDFPFPWVRGVQNAGVAYRVVDYGTDRDVTPESLPMYAIAIRKSDSQVGAFSKHYGESDGCWRSFYYDLALGGFVCCQRGVDWAEFRAVDAQGTIGIEPATQAEKLWWTLTERLEARANAIADRLNMTEGW